MARSAIVATLTGLLWVTTAFAQVQAPGAAPALPPHDPRDCLPSSSNNSGSAPKLNEQSAPSVGVICPPPGIDPEISVPAPERGGRTPVIPPPGTPGGDPNVQPK
jgi:hypothetical protein